MSTYDVEMSLLLSLQLKTACIATEVRKLAAAALCCVVVGGVGEGTVVVGCLTVVGGVGEGVFAGSGSSALAEANLVLLPWCNS